MSQNFNDKPDRAFTIGERVKHAADALSESAAMVERNRCCNAVEVEPELDDAMPDDMWEALRNDRDAMETAMRVVVQKTKQAILARIKDESFEPYWLEWRAHK